MEPEKKKFLATSLLTGAKRKSEGTARSYTTDHTACSLAPRENMEPSRLLLASTLPQLGNRSAALGDDGGGSSSWAFPVGAQVDAQVAKCGGC